ncbi:MAG: dihydroorotase [Euryarchaeota archaeon]|nr:dihydroorotase [Euryarchaeota archaeon]
MSIVAYSGKVLYKGQLIEAELGVDEEGIIVGVRKHFEDAKHVSFSGKLIVPGAIDVHVHFRDPGYTHKEDFKTGSTAALAGGVTTVFDMPNTNPRTKDSKSFKKKLRIASKRSTIDFGIYGGIWPDSNIKELVSLTRAFKVYLYEWTNLEDLKRVIKEIPNDCLISIHAEHPKFIKEGDYHNLEDYNKLRPPEAEFEGVKIALEIMEGKKVHIAHVSTEKVLNFLIKKPNTFEVTPHHLLLNKDMNIWPYGIVNPPLRTKSDNDALWRAFFRGNIPVYASDHAPHDIEEKERENPPPGVPGIQEALPLMLVFVKEGIIRIEDLMTMYSYTPALITGLKGLKGTLEPGAYADFLVIDLGNEVRIREEMILYKCGWTLYKRLRAIFPSYVFIRGEPLVENGEVNEEPGFGKYVYSKDFKPFMI